MASKLLLKSKYLYGLQCSKYLWILFNEPEKIPAPDTVTQYTFAQGNLAGELAKKRFPDGIEIPVDDFMGNLKFTKELLQQRKTLFEAGIMTGHIFARIDVLNPVHEDEWDIFEVKSSTSVKDVHIHDASFQRYCCEESGLKIRKCFIMYINNKYIRNGGEVNPLKLDQIRPLIVYSEMLS